MNFNEEFSAEVTQNSLKLSNKQIWKSFNQNNINFHQREENTLPVFITFIAKSFEIEVSTQHKSVTKGQLISE